MNTELHTLAYVSRRALGDDGNTVDEIERILGTARRNNHAQGLTGALLYSEGSFAQVLEGTLSAVELIFEKIVLDARHSNVTVLHFEPLKHRRFGDWSMAYAGSIDANQLPLAANHVADGPDEREDRDLIALLSYLVNK